MSTTDELSQLRETLASIERKLNLGISSTSNNGVSASFDLEQLRRRKNELERQIELCEAELEGRCTSTFLRPLRLP